MKIDIPSYLTDDALVARVKSLARCEQEATASLVAHLAELDARRLYLAAGFSSLFTDCCEVLHLSEPAAYNRIEAARAARRFPVILQMLGAGSLSLATAPLLAAHLTAENHRELLAAGAGKSKRQVEELLVRYFPRPEVPPSVRKLPAGRAVLALSSATLPECSDMSAAEPVGIPPLRGDLRLREQERRCNERAFVEFHHVDPHGVGGEATAQNIRLRCRAHNAFESELFYGHGRPMERRTLPGKSEHPWPKATTSTGDP
jgi:hypothetical protein